MSATILILDHNQQRQREIGAAIERLNHRPLASFTVREARQLLAGQYYEVDLVIVDLATRDLDIESFLNRMHQALPHVPVIVQGLPEDREAITAALDLGAHDFLLSPSSPERLATTIRNGLRFGWLWKTETEEINPLSPQDKHALVNGSRAMQDFIQAVQAHPAGTPLAINIPSGAPVPSIAELVRQNLCPDGDIVYLSREDAIIPKDRGKRLLVIPRPEALRPETRHRFLQTAGDNPVLFFSRAEENSALPENVKWIEFPSLRNRLEDLDGLIDQALLQSASRPGGRALSVSSEVRTGLRKYDWPGDVAELNNAFFKAQLMSHDDILLPRDFPDVFDSSRVKALVRGEIREGNLITISGDEEIVPETTDADQSETGKRPLGPIVGFYDEAGNLRPFTDVERDCILHALISCDDNVTAAAKALGLGRATMYRKLKQYGIQL